jgi:integrase
MIKIATILQKTRALKDGSFPIVMRFTLNGQRKYYSTGFKIKDPSLWIPNAGLFIVSARKTTDGKIDMNQKLEILKQRAKSYIYNSLDDDGVIFANIINFMGEKQNNNLYIKNGRKFAARLIKTGNHGTARRYNYVFNTFEKFLNGKDVIFERMNEPMIIRYIEYSNTHGHSKITVFHNVKLLKAYYTKAIAENLVEEKYYPFKKIRLKEVKSQPRAISKDDLARVRDIDLASRPAIDRARDIFMFSFYTRGMSYVDVVNMKVNDIIEDRYHYSRSKTSRLYSIKLVKEAMNIILKYNDLTDKNAYVFPLIKDNGIDAYQQYKSSYVTINRHIKSIGEMLELPTKLTSYVSRHTWATLAKRSGISTSIISAGLGHSTERVT